jgi:hypothetical protein
MGLPSAGQSAKTGHSFFVSYQGTRETNGANDQSLYKSVLIADGLTEDTARKRLL